MLITQSVDIAFLIADKLTLIRTEYSIIGDEYIIIMMQTNVIGIGTIDTGKGTHWILVIMEYYKKLINKFNVLVIKLDQLPTISYADETC
jgi:hypothetical protein